MVTSCSQQQGAARRAMRQAAIERTAVAPCGSNSPVIDAGRLSELPQYLVQFGNAVGRRPDTAPDKRNFYFEGEPGVDQ